MPFSGNNFVRNQNFVRDRDAGAPDNTISADKVDNEFANLADGLTQVMTAGATTRALLPTPSLDGAGSLLSVNAAGTAFRLTRLAEHGLEFFRDGKATEWFVPPYVTAITILAIGAGGKGEMNNPWSSRPHSGGGGGAGGLILVRIPVTHGQTLTVQAGSPTDYSTMTRVALPGSWTLQAWTGGRGESAKGGAGGSCTVSSTLEGIALKVMGGTGTDGAYFEHESVTRLNGGSGASGLFGTGHPGLFGNGGPGAELSRADVEARNGRTGLTGAPGLVVFAY